MPRRSGHDYPKWDQPSFRCPLCPELPPFTGWRDAGRRKRHLLETHNRVLVWRCPYCHKGKEPDRFDDLRTHVRTHYQRGVSLLPAVATLERTGWQEEKEKTTRKSTRRSDKSDKKSERRSYEDSSRSRSRDRSRKTSPDSSSRRRHVRTPAPSLSPPRKVIRRSASPPSTVSGPLLPSPLQEDLGLTPPNVELSPVRSSPPTTPAHSPDCARVRGRKSGTPRKRLATSTTAPEGLDPIPEQLEDSPQPREDPEEPSHSGVGQQEVVTPVPESPAQSPAPESPVSAPVQPEPAPRAIWFQEVLSYLDQATPAERQEARDLLQPVTREQETQVRPGVRNFGLQVRIPTRSVGTQTTRGQFTITHNPDGSQQLENPTISIRLLEPLVVLQYPQPGGEN